MKMTVGFNGDLDLIPKLAKYPVDSIFTKMTKDILGGGRSSFILGQIDMDHIKKVVKTANDHNIKMIYLLNSACQSNFELTRSYNNELVEFIGDLHKIGVRHVVVATPYMLDLVKQNFPDIHVSVSVFAIIDNAHKAKFWEERGADCLIIAPNINRNFDEIKRIRAAVNCELEIFTNVTCLYQCPYAQFHANAVSHASTSKDKNKGFVIDYNVTNCSINKLTSPVEMIKGRWIRPEDISYYEELGIDLFKIADRQKPSDWMLNTVKAYGEQSYDGNLVDLLPFPMIKGSKTDFEISNHAKTLLKPKHVNIEVLKRYRDKENVYVNIDNKNWKDF